MNDQYDFENRLHEFPFDLPSLQIYWDEYSTFSSVSDASIAKIIREFAHKYFQITNTAYTDGVLVTTQGFTMDRTTITLDSTTTTLDRT